MEERSHLTDIPPVPEVGREQPDFLHLIFVILAMLLGLMTGSGIAAAIGFQMELPMSVFQGQVEGYETLAVRNFLRWSNLISHVLTFSVPAILVTWLMKRQRTWSYLALSRTASLRILLMVPVFIIACFPVAQLTYWLNRQIPLPEWMTEMETSTEALLRLLMVMDTPSELLLNLLVVAVVPAIGEELIFRGILQQKLQGWLQRGHLAIWITAVCFSAIHFQFAGFLPRMILGAALGYLFFWTRNLWVPIWGHFLFNALQVLAQYRFGAEIEDLDDSATGYQAWLLGLAALTVLYFAGQWIRRNASSLNAEEAYGG